MIREKKIKSGKLLEVDIYPVARDGRQLPRGSPSKRSSREQEKYNRLKAKKRAVRLVNANFDGSDVLMTLTYSPGRSPEDEARAKKDITNYLARVKRYRGRRAKELKAEIKAHPKSRKLKDELKKAEAPMKYIYTLETKTYRRGERKGERSYHFHLFLTGCGSGDRDAYEGLWQGRTNADRFCPEKFGPEAAAKYICKEEKPDEDPFAPKKHRKKTFVGSRNLSKPKEKIRDGKITPNRARIMAERHSSDSGYWERLYKGYKTLKIYTRWNEFNCHWYISVVMYRGDDDPPPWDEKIWVDEE